MDNRSGDSAGGFKVQVRANTTKFTNMVIARFGKSRYLVKLVKNEVEFCAAAVELRCTHHALVHA